MSINAQNEASPDSTGTPAGAGTTDSAAAAARLLALTARDTDQWRAEARSEADAVVTAAREEAAEIVRVAREEAEKLTNDARVEAYREREKAERFSQLAADHREQLRTHLTAMLDQVDAIPDGSRTG